MPRRARLFLPGVPLHVVQRGVNRGAVFLCDEDRLHYRTLLGEVLDDHAVALHAYVLMDNHVHLLLSVGDAARLARAMRLLNQCYAQLFNQTHGRTGPLWEGRFKSCLVDSESYLLHVYRYIDLNPVRAALCVSAGDYPWSSARHHLGLAGGGRVTDHESFLALGACAEQRALAYRRWLSEGVIAEELASIRQIVAQECALGSPRFHAMAERALGRPTRWRARGRPVAEKSQGDEEGNERGRGVGR